jgi:hypothetical protein
MNSGKRNAVCNAILRASLDRIASVFVPFHTHFTRALLTYAADDEGNILKNRFHFQNTFFGNFLKVSHTKLRGILYKCIGCDAMIKI